MGRLLGFGRVEVTTGSPHGALLLLLPLPLSANQPASSVPRTPAMQSLSDKLGWYAALTGINLMMLIARMLQLMDFQASHWYRIRVACAASAGHNLTLRLPPPSSQPRLGVVTRSLAEAGPDLLHFGLVFGLVFIGFAMTAHLIFGNSVAGAVRGEEWEVAAWLSSWRTSERNSFPAHPLCVCPPPATPSRLQASALLAAPLTPVLHCCLGTRPSMRTSWPSVACKVSVPQRVCRCGPHLCVVHELEAQSAHLPPMPPVQAWQGQPSSGPLRSWCSWCCSTSCWLSSWTPLPRSEWSCGMIGGPQAGIADERSPPPKLGLLACAGLHQSGC